MTAADESTEPVPPRRREVSGTLVVVCMLAMGSAAAALMYVYWDLHTKPFRPLTEAIGRTFKYSLPKVEGGRHKKGPMTLRVALRVPIQPVPGDPETEEVLAKIRALIREHQDLSGYKQVQIHLFQVVPEESAKSQRFEYTPAEILEATLGAGEDK